MNKVVHVAVGVIKSENAEGFPHYFLTKRLENAHQGGKWEFPGGKVEADETVAQALARELKEEVGIDILSCQALIKIEHTYLAKDKSKQDKHVCLDVYLVDNFLGEPSAQEGQGEGWFTLKQFDSLEFPEANKEIIAELKRSSTG
ncbi:8-oxo-dGTP diphosphatase MutT [Colwellia echini]|uniref:8-oxo-dGTP diphosphatase n=1 Tax=Colwellia echini TaxID=1982103 RepID=A0ABY3MVW8_9GAMM|nr:8-oxo-dGTP diphosphatase MutT [Colwellia echini]TYK65340.1 8-oxo-dGTP diphosphatase MutT [Colwellia echini]